MTTVEDEDEDEDEDIISPRGDKRKPPYTAFKYRGV
jgi:hypothetical protein